MKRVFFTAAIAACLAVVGCNEGGSTTTEGEETATISNTDEETTVTPDNVEQITSIEFTEEAFDFGAITQGEKAEHTFKFKNTGDHDLVIVSAKGSCGCTIPKWPKEPIAPGEEGEMFVVFNSEGKKGKQHKKVTVVANTEPATTVVALRGEVIVPESAEAPAEATAQ